MTPNEAIELLTGIAPTNTVEQPGITRAEIIESLSYLAKAAHREVSLVAKFTNDPPTAWDRRHATINDLLCDLERTRG